MMDMAQDGPGGPQDDGLVDLVADEDLRIRWLAGSGSDLVLAFSGVQHQIGRTGLAEFVGTAHAGGSRDVLFISDMKRSWFSAPGLVDRIAATVTDHMARHGLTRLYTVGNSMGGYGAVLFASRLPVRVACAFAPQVSMHPEVIDEPRWQDFRPFIGPGVARSLNGSIQAAQGQVVMIFGEFGDHAQRALLEPAPNLHLNIVARCGHDAVKRLKQAGVLSDLVDLAFREDFDGAGRLVRSLGRPRGALETRLRALARGAERRLRPLLGRSGGRD